MNDIIISLREDLISQSEASVRISSKRFFKESIETYGVKAANVRVISKKYFNQIKSLPKSQIFDLCEILFRSNLLEESFIACNWSHGVHRKFEPDDMLVFKKWIQMYVHNWATCDTFCNHTVGAFIEMFPEKIEILKDMAVSDNRWERRAVAVSLIIPARKGKFLQDIFQISDMLLMDKDDLVQKAYGWLLKVASDRHLNDVFEYVIRNKQIMPRTALRYAIEKMPSDLRKQAMMK